MQKFIRRGGGICPAYDAGLRVAGASRRTFGIEPLTHIRRHGHVPCKLGTHEPNCRLSAPRCTTHAAPAAANLHCTNGRVWQHCQRRVQLELQTCLLQNTTDAGGVSGERKERKPSQGAKVIQPPAQTRRNFSQRSAGTDSLLAHSAPTLTFGPKLSLGVLSGILAKRTACV